MNFVTNISLDLVDFLIFYNLKRLFNRAQMLEIVALQKVELKKK